MSTSNKDMPVNLWSYLIERDIDPVTQTISMGFIFNVAVGDDECPDLGRTSPYFARIDQYYERVCKALLPDANRWEWVHMVAGIDVGAVPGPFVGGTEEMFYINTKWFVATDLVDRFLQVIEDLDLADASGLEVTYVEGISKDAPPADDSDNLNLATALYPLDLETAKTYPLNFRRGTNPNPAHDFPLDGTKPVANKTSRAKKKSAVLEAVEA